MLPIHRGPYQSFSIRTVLVPRPSAIKWHLVRCPGEWHASEVLVDFSPKVSSDDCVSDVTFRVAVMTDGVPVVLEVSTNRCLEALS